MGSDRNFFFDFQGGLIDRWRLVQKGVPAEVRAKQGAIGFGGLADEFALEADIESDANQETIICLNSDSRQIELKAFDWNGTKQRIGWSSSLVSFLGKGYAHSNGLSFAYRVSLRKGRNTLKVFCRKIKPGDSFFFAARIWAETLAQLPENPHPDFVLPWTHVPHGHTVRRSENLQPSLLKEFSPGIGGARHSAGRFGFSKGDGLLDCAMPVLGIIDRMYLCGHPEFHKPRRWAVSFIPPGLDGQQQYRGSYPPAGGLTSRDRVEINHVSVKWSTTWRANKAYFERKSGDTVRFSCLYSVASPGIVIETSDPALSVRELDAAGQYTEIALPLEKGIVFRNIAGRERLYDRKQDKPLRENWAAISGCAHFPDIPLFFVFQKNPQQILVQSDKAGRICGLDFHAPPRVGAVIVAAPFGIKAFAPGENAPAAARQNLVRKCRFWSRALKAMPVDCADFYRIDEHRETVEIIQKFKYYYFKDKWGMPPIKLAPLPPPIGLLDELPAVAIDPDAEDLEFPTKYGPLKAVVGRDFSRYRLPLIPCSRKFPLAPAGDSNVSRMLEEDMDKFLAFHARFKDTELPYVYAGGFVDPYAFTLTMFNFLKPEYRATLAAKAAAGGTRAVNPSQSYEYLATDFCDMMSKMPSPARVLEIYANPDIVRKTFFSWYERREPFTGLSYHITYINVHLANWLKSGARKGIAACREPLIENDWGTGLAFYGIYLSALISGKWDMVKKNWKTLKSAFRYFEVMHDWACMATAYSEDGVSWVEGANYGAFVGFTQMARAMEDRAAWRNAAYLSAKQGALRMAVFRSSQNYFHKYFGRKPWWITKFFHEEAQPANAFTGVPRLVKDKYRDESIYNLTTEGLFPETFMLFLKYLPEEFREVLRIFRRTNPDYFNKPMSIPPVWQHIQETSSCLLAMALDSASDPADVEHLIDRTARTGALMREWRGIHIPSRLLPKNWFKAYLTALNMTRTHPVWLELWHGVNILKAEYDSKTATAALQVESSPQGWIAFGFRSPPRETRFNGKLVKNMRLAGAHWIIPLGQSGSLTIKF